MVQEKHFSLISMQMQCIAMQYSHALIQFWKMLLNRSKRASFRHTFTGHTTLIGSVPINYQQHTHISSFLMKKKYNFNYLMRRVYFGSYYFGLLLNRCRVPRETLTMTII